MSAVEDPVGNTGAGAPEPDGAFVPQHRGGRFKPGQSGNPKGRPRKAVRQSKPLSPLQKAMAEEVSITGHNGKKQRITASEAVARRMVQKAVQGDPAMMKLLLAHNPDMITAMPANSTGDHPSPMQFICSRLSTEALREFRNAVAELAELTGSGPKAQHRRSPARRNTGRD